MRLFPALALAALIAAPAALASDLPDPGPVVAAERAFAEETGRIGIDRGFLKHATPDAILINAQVARVVDVMDAEAAEQPPAPSLVWFPIWAGVSRSGDLGFSSGPIEVGGRRGGSYFTVWKRQADGSWKWVYDGGVGASSKDDPGPDSRPVFLPTSTAGAGTAAAAMAEVGHAEAELARLAATDQKAAHLAVFAPDGRLHAAPSRPPAIPRPWPGCWTAMARP